MRTFARIALWVVASVSLIGGAIPITAAQLCLFEFNGDDLYTERANGLAVSRVVFAGARVENPFTSGGEAHLATDLAGEYAVSLRYTATDPANVFPAVTFRHHLEIRPEPGYVLRLTGLEYDVWYEPFSFLFSTASAWAEAGIYMASQQADYPGATLPVGLENNGAHCRVTADFGSPGEPVEFAWFELVSETPWLISPGLSAEGPPETRTHRVSIDNIAVYGSITLIPEPAGTPWVLATLLSGLSALRQLCRRTRWRRLPGQEKGSVR